MSRAIDVRDVFRIHRTAEGDAAALQGLTLSVEEVTVLASKRGTAALEDLRQRLRSGIDESEPLRTAREAVDALLQKAKAGSEDDADRSVRVYADFVAKQYAETAVAHAPKQR